VKIFIIIIIGNNLNMIMSSIIHAISQFGLIIVNIVLIINIMEEQL